MKRTQGLFMGLLGGSLGLVALPAAALDAPAFVQNEVLKCIHPTAKLEKAKAEIDKPAVTEGDVTKTRVKVFYEGMVKKNSMLVEVQERAGNPPLVKVQVLEDTSSVGSPAKCKYVEGWQELKK